MNEARSYPNLARTIGLLLATLVLAAALAAAMLRAFPAWPDVLRMAVPTEAALLLAVGWGVKRSRRGWRRTLAWRPIEARSIVPLALVLAGALTVFSEIYVVIQKLVPVPDAFQDALRRLLELSGGADTVATVVVAVVVAPILEEALFRGVILQGLARDRGPNAATVWTAVFFALFHFYNPWQVVPTFFLGLVLAWLVLTTRSLLSSIAVHAAFNGASLALFAFPFGRFVRPGGPAGWLVAGVVALFLLGSVALLAGMAWLERQTGGGWYAERARDDDAYVEGPSAARG